MSKTILVQFILIFSCFDYLFSNNENSEARGGGIPQDSEQAYLRFKQLGMERHLSSEDREIAYHMILNEAWEKGLLDGGSNREADSGKGKNESANGYSIFIDPEVRKSLAKDPIVRVTVSPKYPINLKANRVTGQVLTRFIINEEGDVISPTVLKSDNRNFNDNVIEALRQWKFSPAERNGEAVRIEARLLFLFGLKSG